MDRHDRPNPRRRRRSNDTEIVVRILVSVMGAFLIGGAIIAAILWWMDTQFDRIYR